MTRTTRRTRAARTIAAATGRSYQAALESLRTDRPTYTVTGPLPADAALAWVLAHHATTPMTVIGDAGSGRLLLGDAVGQAEQHRVLPVPLTEGHTLLLMHNRVLADDLDAAGDDGLLRLLTGRDLAPDLRAMRIGEALVLTCNGVVPPVAAAVPELRDAALAALSEALLVQEPLVEHEWLRVDIWAPTGEARGQDFRVRLSVLDPDASRIRARDAELDGVVRTALWALHRGAPGIWIGTSWAHGRLLRTPDGQLHLRVTPGTEAPPAVPAEPVDVRMAPGSGKSVRMVQFLATGVDPAGFRPR